jgi:hypothetical protein
MGTEAGLALAAGFFGGMFVTAATLWFHERRTRRALEAVSARVHRNEARTHALLRESRDVLALIGRDGNLKYVSPAADRMLGRSSAKFVGTTVRYTTAKTATWFGQVSDPLITGSGCCGSARKLSGGDWVMGWGGTQTATEMTPGGIRVFLLQFASGILYRTIPVPVGQLNRAALRAGMDAQYSSSAATHTATQSQLWKPTAKQP